MADILTEIVELVVPVLAGSAVLLVAIIFLSKK
jgi:hypothetical protein